MEDEDKRRIDILKRFKLEGKLDQIAQASVRIPFMELSAQLADSSLAQGSEAVV